MVDILPVRMCFSGMRVIRHGLASLGKRWKCRYWWAFASVQRVLTREGHFQFDLLARLKA